MNVTIDISDELYRRVKARSALEGRAVRDVTIELFQRWLDERAGQPDQSGEQWPENWFRLADEMMRDAPPGPSAREILERGRNRV